MARIRFLSDQVYEVGGPKRGPMFPAGFVLDSDQVGPVLGTDEPKEEVISAFLARWVNRGVAERVGNDVDPSDLSEITFSDPGNPRGIIQPFGTARYGRPAAGVDTGADAAPDLGKMTRAELDALAAERGVDISAAKNKDEVIQALSAASQPQKPE